MVATETGLAQFLKAHQKVGQVVNPASDQSQPEFQGITSGVVSLVVEGRLDHKGARHILEVVEPPGTGRAWRLEDPAVGTDHPGLALVGVAPARGGTCGALEGVAEAAAQQRALVGREGGWFKKTVGDAGTQDTERGKG